MNKPVVITTLTWILTGVSIPAVAQNIPVCYMQLHSGQIVSLSSLCGGSEQIPSPLESISTKDRQFLEDYKRVLMSLKGSPEAQAALSSATPSALIRQANEVCSTLNAGTFIEFQQAQNAFIAGYGNPQSQRIANLQARTVQTLAPRTYCPGFDG